MNTQTLHSRISIRAAGLGTMVTLCFMLMSLSLMVVFGFWNFKVTSITDASMIFWLSSAVSWAVSMFIGGGIAGLAARSQNKLEGVLNALGACCGAYLLSFLFVLGFAYNSVWDLINWKIMNSSLSPFVLKVFLAHFISFVCGIYGGVVAARFEQRPLARGAKEKEKKFAHYETSFNEDGKNISPQLN